MKGMKKKKKEKRRKKKKANKMKQSKVEQKKKRKKNTLIKKWTEQEKWILQEKKTDRLEGYLRLEEEGLVGKGKFVCRNVEEFYRQFVRYLKTSRYDRLRSFPAFLLETPNWEEFQQKYLKGKNARVRSDPTNWWLRSITASVSSSILLQEYKVPHFWILGHWDYIRSSAC